MFLDTSIIIELFRSDKNGKKFNAIYEVIEDETLFISIFQFAEISDWCLKNNIDPAEPPRYLKDLVNVIHLNEDICIEASRIKYNMRKKGMKKFSLADGIVLASARSIDQTVLTKDKDFQKLKDTIII